MVNADGFRSYWPLALGVAVLTAAGWLRGAEYDEQYTLFLTAGTPRPDWPTPVFPAGTVAAVQAGHATIGGIMRDLRATDVHPPLYFWVVWLWRLIFGSSLFAARLLSVVFGVASLALVGAIARRCRVSPVTAMLVTLCCYGFVYTNAIARGFALSETLTLGGVALLLDRRRLLAGLCLGAACCCNYLAVFVAAAVVLVTGSWLAALSAIPFMAMDGWFFVAQHGARPDQFPPFDAWHAMVRLAEYQVAAVFGGLPLYFDGDARLIATALVGVAVVGLAWRCVRGVASRMLWAAALAPPAGLLALGVVFDNTPIELRSLSFGLPFVGLLASKPVGLDRAGTWRPVALAAVLGVQIASITGLLFGASTMQPARAAAIAASRLIGDGIVLLPYGNDGVGTVGAFGIEAPPALPILLFRTGDPAPPFRRVALVTLMQDRDSSAAVQAMRATLLAGNWRRVATGSNVEIYEHASE